MDKNKIEIIKTVLNYWYVIEFLNQEKIPSWSAEDKKKANEVKKQVLNSAKNLSAEVKKKNSANKLHIFYEVKPKNTDIYKIIKECAQEYGMTRWGNITIYAGKIKRELCIEKIASLLNEPDKRVEKTIEKIAWVSLQTGPDLRYIERSFSLSPVIWAINQLKDIKENDNMSEKLAKALYDSVDSQYDLELTAINQGVKSEEAYDRVENADEEDKKQYKLDDEGKYIQEYAYSLKKEDIVDLQKSIYTKYLKHNIKFTETDEFKRNYDMESGIWLDFVLYKDDETWNQEEEEEYHGLCKNYFASDIEMVLEKAGEIIQGSGMQRRLADYIVSRYEEAYGKNDRKRVDLLHVQENSRSMEEYKNILLDIMRPDKAPLGKWPSRYMPAFMQQVAINLAISGNEPIFSVNGPPGTGKTTLLKEIVVHNVVERAKLLVNYDDPDDAFNHLEFKHGNVGKKNAYTKWAQEYHELKDDRINDFSVVVASCNNTAVENITKELPIEDKITEALGENKSDSVQMKSELKEIKKLFSVSENSVAEWIKEIEENFWFTCKENAEAKGEVFDEPLPDCRNIYFTKYARNLFGEKAWGLIAAPLGKRSNIHDFYKKVLKNLDYALCSEKMKRGRLQEYQKICQEFKIQLDVVEKMQLELRFLSDLEGHKEWNDLQEKLMYVEAEKNKLYENLYENKQKENILKEKLCIVQRECHLAEEDYNKANRASCEMTKKITDLRQKYMQAETERNSLPRIGIVSKWFNTKKAREITQKYSFYSQEMDFLIQEMEIYNKDKIKYEKQYSVKRKECELKQDNEKRLKQKWEERVHKIQDIESAIKEIEKKRESYFSAMEKIHKEYLEHVARSVNGEDSKKFQWLNDEFVQNLLSKEVSKSTEAHVLNPWFTAEYNRQRERLFYIALRLHESFALASRSVRDNIINLELYWKERKRDDGKKVVLFHTEDAREAVGKLYQTLFLLVPVVSTTFASVGTFLKDVGAGEIGRLVIDEAGQALPQMAVGALYRARKAIVVGDPRQIEPVVTDDLQLIKRAYERNEIERLYVSTNISVQTFADSLNKYGTWLEFKGVIEWVGCPLIVHRRCISPMFEISNEISYSQIMKQKTIVPNEEKQRTFVYSESKWLAVKGHEVGNKNHFVEEQARAVIQILEVEFVKNEVPDVYIISPFTTVVFGMKNELEKYIEANQQSAMYGKVDSEWLSKHIGTVHTFQGKEADEVIFLLGCDEKKAAEGAIKWVNENIVNVAVTRARYRLYVVGDDVAWGKSEIFNQVLQNIKLDTKKE